MELSIDLGEETTRSPLPSRSQTMESNQIKPLSPSITSPLSSTEIYSPVTPLASQSFMISPHDIPHINLVPPPSEYFEIKPLNLLTFGKYVRENFTIDDLESGCKLAELALRSPLRDSARCIDVQNLKFIYKNGIGEIVTDDGCKIIQKMFFDSFVEEAAFLIRVDVVILRNKLKLRVPCHAELIHLQSMVDKLTNFKGLGNDLRLEFRQSLAQLLFQVK